jgi:hypothetical protein
MRKFFLTQQLERHFIPYVRALKHCGRTGGQLKRPRKGNTNRKKCYYKLKTFLLPFYRADG